MVAPAGDRRLAFGRMTFQARHRRMRSFEREWRGLVSRHGESGRMKAFSRMAVFAAVPKTRGELSAVRIFVAVQAGVERRVIVRIKAGGQVTLLARHFLMPGG
jgi:hypothetical protein